LKNKKSCNQILKDLDIEKNQGIQEYLNKLSATLETNYSLWKAKNISNRRYITRLSGSRTRAEGARSEKEKVETFAEHFSKVFKPKPEGDYTKRRE